MQISRVDKIPEIVCSIDEETTLFESKRDSKVW